MPYQYFTVNDFLDDSSFRNYVLQKDESDVAFWKQWIAQNPYKRTEIAEAEKLILLFAAEAKSTVLKEEKAAEWNKLWTRIQRTATEEENLLEEEGVAIENPKRVWLWRAVAASVVLVVVLVQMNFFNHQSKGVSSSVKLNTKEQQPSIAPNVEPKQDELTVIETPYGKTQKLTLPDGSKVILNANSSIYFPKDWSKHGDRVVWLKGEAEFSIHHYDLPDGNAQKFIVKTAEVNVMVLGTKFNLMDRKGKCKLALYEGKVQLLLTKYPQEESIAIVPNEIVQVDNGNIVRISPLKKVALYQAWTKNSFEFEDTPLSDVAQVIENAYGYKFEFKDESLKNKRLTASIPENDVIVLAKVITQIFNLKSEIKENTILFE